MSGQTILIVEDDATIARFVELELQHAGYTVLRAGDGPTAIDLFLDNDIDLVILDLMLPGIDGIDVARHIRKRGSEVPILMLTARAETRDVVAGFEAGADDYLRKPFEIPELMSRVRALLKRTSPPALRRTSRHRVSRSTPIGGWPRVMVRRSISLRKSSICSRTWWRTLGV